jgi:hypothetical protein
MSADTFDTDPSELPPVTRALRECWTTQAGPGNYLDAVASTFSMRAVLDAVHALEVRVIALEGA